MTPSQQSLLPRLLLGIVVTTLLLTVMAAPTAAQTAGKTWEIGFDVGSGAIADDDDLKLDLRTAGRAGYFFGDRVQLEIQILRADAILDAELSAALGNVLIQLRPEARVAPYLLAGVGIARIEDVDFFDFLDDQSQGEPEDGTALQVGFGTRIFLGDSDVMALRIEASSLWTDTDLFGSTQNASLTVGLSWSFGR